MIKCIVNSLVTWAHSKKNVLREKIISILIYIFHGTFLLIAIMQYKIKVNEYCTHMFRIGLWTLLTDIVHIFINCNYAI